MPRPAGIRQRGFLGEGTRPETPKKEHIMDISKFKVEESKASEGVWIDGPQGSRFKIRSADSKAYKRTMAALARRESPNKVRKDPETQTRITIRAMAEEIIVDWEGIENEGVTITPTLENKIILLGVTELRELIATEAQDLANFRAEGLAADAADVKSND